MAEDRPVYYRMLVAILALIGFFDAAYLYISRFYASTSMVCPVTGGGCDTVRDSAWSMLPPGSGIPIALIGLVGYTVVFGLALAALHTNRLGAWALPPLLAGLSTVGVVFSVYLMGVQLFIIQAVCSWCALSSLLMLCIWVLTVIDWRSWRQTSSAVEHPVSNARPRLP